MSKKKHGAVGVITWISVVGVAVATAATICVLSVFNGFQLMLGQRLELLSPDVEITSKQGKTFTASDSLANALLKLPDVADVCPVVCDRALAVYDGQEMPVRIMGVDTEKFRRHSRLDSLLVYGSDTFEPRMEEDVAEGYAASDDEFSEEEILAQELGSRRVEQSVVSAGVGMRLAIRQNDPTKLSLISPRRQGSVNLANPVSSLEIMDVGVEGVYQSLHADFDKDYVIIPLTAARELLEIDHPAVTALYVYARPGVTPQQLAGAVRRIAGPQLKVLDRLQQHESQFRMSNIEKWITFLLLAFILLIASFNLISSLAMLVIDKQENLGVLHALGASRGKTGNIFAWESGLVTLTGGTIGIVLGISLSLAQEHWGWIKLGGEPGTLIMESYPAHLQASDILAVAVPLFIIGALTACITARFARSRLQK